MKYLYKGLDINNRKTIKGLIEADDEKEARILLRNRGINVNYLRKDWKSIEIRFSEKN